MSDPGAEDQAIAWSQFSIWRFDQVRVRPARELAWRQNRPPNLFSRGADELSRANVEHQAGSRYFK